MRNLKIALSLCLAYILGGLTMLLLARPELVRSTFRAVRIGPHGGWPPLRFVDWQSWPKGVRRLWPPPHAGGLPGLDDYDEAFNLIEQEGLSLDEAWEWYQAKNPLQGDPNPLLYKRMKRNFMEAMRRRRARN